MKVNATIIKNHNISLKTKATDKNTINAFLSVASGMISGCIIFLLCDENTRTAVGELFNNFFHSFIEKDSFSVLLTIIANYTTYFFAVFLFGTSIIGKNMIRLITVLKFSGLGLISSFLYYTYTLEGLEYCILIFFSGKIVLLPASLLLIKNSMDYCDSLKHPDTVISESRNRYIIENILLGVLFLFAATADFFFIKLFSSLFSF